MTTTLATWDFPADCGSEREDQSLRLESILVPLDLSELSLGSLRYAVPLARLFGARLTLLHVVEPPPPLATLPYSAMLEDRDPQWAHRRLEEIRAREFDEDIDVKTVVRHGCIYDQILSVAREVRADLIVTTTHGLTGLKHLLVGSTAESIAHGAPCAVLVVRDRAD